MSEVKPVQRLSQWLKTSAREAPLSQPEAFGELYQRAHLLVFRYLYGLRGGAQAEAEDLTAETFARAWKSRQHFTGSPEAAVGWLLRIARSLAIDSYRRGRVRQDAGGFPLDALPSPQALPEEQVAAGEQQQVLLRLLQALPAETRELLALRYLLGWPVKAIGAHLGIPENTVSVSLRRALKRLRASWPGATEENDV